MFKNLFPRSSSENFSGRGENKWAKRLAAGTSSANSSSSGSEEKITLSEIPTLRRRHSLSHPYLVTALEEEQNTHDNSDLSINPFESPLLKRSKSLPFNLVKQPSISKFRRKEIKSVRFESMSNESESNRDSFSKRVNQDFVHSPERSITSEYSESPEANKYSDFNSILEYKYLEPDEPECYPQVYNNRGSDIFVKNSPVTNEDEKWFERIAKDSGRLNLEMVNKEKSDLFTYNSNDKDFLKFVADNDEVPTTTDKSEKNSELGSILGLLSFEPNSSKDKSLRDISDKDILRKIVINLSSFQDDNLQDCKIDCENVDEALKSILTQSESFSSEASKIKQELELKKDEILKLIVEKEELLEKERNYQEKVDGLNTSHEKLRAELNLVLGQLSKGFKEEDSKTDKEIIKDENEDLLNELHNQLLALEDERNQLIELNKELNEQMATLEKQNNEYESILYYLKEGIDAIVSENENYKENNGELIIKLSDSKMKNQNLTNTVNEYNRIISEKNSHIENYNDKLSKAMADFITAKNEVRSLSDFKERYELERASYENLLKLNKEAEISASSELELLKEELKNVTMTLNKVQEKHAEKDLERESLITNMTKYSNELRYKNSELTNELILTEEKASQLKIENNQVNKKFKELNLQNSKAYKILKYYDNRVEELTILTEKSTATINNLEESQNILKENIIDLINNSFEQLSPVMYEESSIYFRKLLDEFMSKNIFCNDDKNLVQKVIRFIIDTISDLVKKFLSNKSSLECEINRRNINYDKMLEKLGRIMEDQTSKENEPVIVNADTKLPKLRKASRNRKLLPKN